MATLQIGFDGDTVADGQTLDVTAKSDDLGTEFVTEYPWILKEWLTPTKCVQVRAADPNATNSQGRMAGRWSAWLSGVRPFESTRFSKLKCPHVAVVSVSICVSNLG